MVDGGGCNDDFRDRSSTVSIVAVECLNMMRVSYVGEICLNIRPQQTVAPSDHHPVGGQLESTGRVEEIVGSLLEHQPGPLHYKVLVRPEIRGSDSDHGQPGPLTGQLGAL